MEDMIRGAQDSGRHVFLSGARPQVRTILERLGVFHLLKEGHDFPRRLPALKQAAELLGVDPIQGAVLQEQGEEAPSAG